MSTADLILAGKAKGHRSATRRSLTLTSALSDRTVTVWQTSATGTPSPSVMLVAATASGVDVLDDVTGAGTADDPWTYVAPSSADATTVTVTARAENATGDVARSASETVPADLFAPTWDTLPAVSLEGRTVTVTTGSARGATPIACTIVATLDGAPVVMTGAGPWTCEVPSSLGPQDFAATVTAANAHSDVDHDVAQLVAADQALPLAGMTLELNGRTLTITGSAAGEPTPILALHALTLDGVDVLGEARETGPWTYDAPSASDAQTVAVTVRATSAAGTDDASDSIEVAADQFAPVISGLPTIAGTFEAGQTLTATPAAVTGTPTPVRTWQWLRDGAPIPGATSATFDLVADDLAAFMQVRQFETNAAGSDNATSAATDAVLGPPITQSASIATLLPEIAAVGAAFAPDIPGTPAQDGPNLATEANNGRWDGGVSNVVYVAGDDGYVQWDQSGLTLNNDIVAGSALTEGTQYRLEVLDSSVAGTLIRFQERTPGTVEIHGTTNLGPGESVLWTCPANLDDLRVRSGGGALAGIRVRVREVDAVPAEPSQPADDIDLTTLFSGGVGDLTIAVEGLPAGVTATDGVIAADDVPSAGAGGQYNVLVTVTDTLGQSIEDDCEITVNEALSITSVTPRNIDGSTTFREGDTGYVDVTFTGYPPPNPGGSSVFPKWRRNTGADTGSGIVFEAGGENSGLNFTVPEGATHIQTRVYVETEAGVYVPGPGAAEDAVFSSLIAVSQAARPPAAPVIAQQASASWSGGTLTIDTGSANGEPAPTASVTALTLDGVHALRSDVDFAGLTVLETWSTTPGNADWVPYGETASGVAYFHNPWGEWDMAAGDTFDTTAYQDGDAILLRTESELQVGTGLPKGAPFIIVGSHYSIESPVDPLSDGGSQGKLLSTITDLSGSTAIQVDTFEDRGDDPASFLWGFQLYASAVRQAGAWDGTQPSGQQWFDIQIRLATPSDDLSYQHVERGDGVATITVGDHDYEVLVGVSSTPVAGTRAYSFHRLDSSNDPDTLEPATDLDLKAFVEWARADNNSRTSDDFSDLWVYQAGTWIEPRSGRVDATTLGFSATVNGVTYGTVRAPSGATTVPVAQTDETQAVAGTVTWTNSEGSVQSDFTLNIAASAPTGDPLAIPASSWRVADAIAPGGGTLYVAVDPEAVIADADSLDIEVNGSVQRKIGPAGVFTVTGLSGTPSIRVRSVAGSNTGPWTGTKSATPTARSITSFATWAEGEIAFDIPQGQVSNAVVPVATASGMEIQTIDYSASDFRAGSDGNAPIRDVIIAQPQGVGYSLRPCETITESASVGGATRSLTVLGAGGMFTRNVKSIMGFDGDGNPVEFRLELHRQGGVLPDGRPFVVGPARLMHNGGAPVEIDADMTSGYTIVEDRGAQLVVVLGPGIIPPPGAPVTAANLSHAYERHAGTYDFSADGWNDTAAGNGGGAGVTIRANYESLHIYWDRNTSGDKPVRFRKQGDSEWMPALPLMHIPDAPFIQGYPDPYNFRCRGQIQYLEPGTAYEVQIKDGSTYRSVTATTRAYARTLIPVNLGVVEGDVAVTQAGDELRIAVPGRPRIDVDMSGGEVLDIRSSLIRGMMTIPDNLTHNLRISRCWFRGGEQHCIRVEDGAQNLEIFGNTFAGWGRRRGSTQWIERGNNAISLQGFYDTRLIAAHGNFCYSARLPSNTWSEPHGLNIGGASDHPWGWSFMSGTDQPSGSLHGQILMTGNSVEPHYLRASYDGVWGSRGNASIIANGELIGGSQGPDCVVSWNYITNFSDDGAELEGSVSNALFSHNVLWMRPIRQNFVSPRTFKAIAEIHAGPLLCARNLYVLDFQSHGVDTRGGNPIFTKVQSDSPDNGFMRMYHETVWAKTTSIADNDTVPGSVWGGSDRDRPRNISGANCCILARQDATRTGYLPQSPDFTDVVYATNTGQRSTIHAHDDDFRPTGSALVGQGVRVPNVNDGGPAYEASPSIGALVG